MTSDTEASQDGGGSTGPVTDLVAGLFLGGLAILALFWLIPAYTKPPLSEFDVSPGFFPRLAAWAVLILAMGIVATRIRKLADTGEYVAGTLVLVDLAAWTGTGLFAVLGLEFLGFLATAMLLTAIGMFVAGSRSWWMIASVSILFPLLVDQAAWHVFTVELP